MATLVGSMTRTREALGRVWGKTPTWVGVVGAGEIAVQGLGGLSHGRGAPLCLNQGPNFSFSP